MQQTGLLATIALYVVGFAICALPGLVAAGRGAGPWMVCTAVASALSLLFFMLWAPFVFIGVQFQSWVWGPSLLLVGISWLFAWAAIRERRAKKSR